MIVWKNDSDTIILKPIEIRSKRGVKKMKKANSAIYIPNMDAKEFDKICVEKGLQFIYTQVQPHGRLIDTSAKVQTQLYDDEHEEWADVEMTVEDYLGYCHNEAPTIIPAEEGE